MNEIKLLAQRLASIKMTTEDKLKERKRRDKEKILKDIE